MGGGVTVPNVCLDTQGDVPPSEAEKFCIFETGSVQFDKYFWVQI